MEWDFCKLSKAVFQFRQTHLIIPHCFWQCLVLLQWITEIANIPGFRDMADNAHFLVRHGNTFLHTSKGCFQTITLDRCTLFWHWNTAFGSLQKCLTMSNWKGRSLPYRKISEYWLSQLSTVDVGRCQKQCGTINCDCLNDNQRLEVCKNVLPCRTKKLSTVKDLGTAKNSVERSSVIVWTRKQPLDFAEMSYHVELRSGRCLPHREIMRHWLSQLSTVAELVTAKNSVKRSSVIAWTGKQPCRNVFPCRTKKWELSAISRNPGILAISVVDCRKNRHCQ